VKGIALWALLTSLAFLVTASAFLLLASLGGDPESAPIPQADPSEAQERATLLLKLPVDRLERLEREPGQRLTLDVENGGDEELVGVDLALDVTYEDTTRPRAGSYRKTIEQLEPGETRSVEFEIDLSPPIPAETRASVPDAEQDREILEIRATAPGDVSSVKTAVLGP
jgi:hypothetical protein